MTFELASVAPRLARARDQWIAEAAREAREAKRREKQRAKAERLLVHRDLQFLRAAASGRRGYTRKRARKLDEAEQIMRRLDP